MSELGLFRLSVFGQACLGLFGVSLSKRRAVKKITIVEKEQRECQRTNDFACFRAHVLEKRPRGKYVVKADGSASAQ